ncbi:dipeptidase [Parvularcula lutaonensis]|uniref:Dipeptidase n=1 Tax=Parvularcula lutaonensis TaxID=491923 RepID=A0ABV7MEW3_9PROT|nr:membrane dipeptidase [Parvularcula lutaonensis]GGY53669.1 dipeptidase [Parvularcula lutaonensis]
MGTLILRIIAGILGFLGLALILFLWLAPPRVDASMNPVVPHAPYEISEEARALHATIPVADLHADSLLWNRDLLKRNDYGHVDIPRLREGGVFLQMFTAVTKTPKGQNYDENDGSTDNIRTLAMAQRWPRRTWDSRTERAIYQAEKLAGFAEDSQVGRDGLAPLEIVRTSADLDELLRIWTGGIELEVLSADGGTTPVSLRGVAAILGTEGSHALDGDLANIDRLFDAGYRVMGLHHFFDNKLGGSLHGTSGEGLTEFGRAAVSRMREKDIIIDVAHSSEQVVREVLAMGAGPLIVSHTGFDGHCPSPRNISDETMEMIAEDGGLIGVGFWEDVTCDASPAGIADAIMWGANRFGVDHIALGSDFDGTVTTELDASELAAITQALMDAGMEDDDIRKVMGGNAVRFFLENLPEG